MGLDARLFCMEADGELCVSESKKNFAKILGLANGPRFLPFNIAQQGCFSVKMTQLLLFYGKIPPFLRQSAARPDAALARSMCKRNHMICLQ